jgi:hypothetical protein
VARCDRLMASVGSVPALAGQAPGGGAAADCAALAAVLQAHANRPGANKRERWAVYSELGSIDALVLRARVAEQPLLCLDLPNGLGEAVACRLVLRKTSTAATLLAQVPTVVGGGQVRARAKTRERHICAFL